METTLFTRTLMKGIADGMTDGGAMRPFANDDVATGVFDKIASDMGLPPVLSEHLPTEAYIKIGQWILAAAKTAEENGLAASPATEHMAKQAASMDLADRALGVAAFYMDKAAEEASLNGTGSNTPESATATNAVARLDQMNRSSLQYLVGMGQTDMPEAGVVGRQMVHPMAPRGPAINNSLTHLDKQAEMNEKVARAITFMQGLINRGADIDGKTVLASAILADNGSTGLEVMANLVQHTKTAADLDSHLDDVREAGEAHGEGADPHLVQAIEHALAEHAGADVDHDEEPGDAEEHAEKAAGLMTDLIRKGKSVAREGYEKAKSRAGEKATEVAGKAKATAEKAKETASRAYERHTSPAVKEKLENLAGKAKGKAEEVAGKAKAKAQEVEDKIRRSTGTELPKSPGALLREASKQEGMKAKLEGLGKAVKRVGEQAEDVAREGVSAVKKRKGDIARAGAAVGAGGLAGYMAGRKDDDEKDAELLDFLKAAADGSLNEVDENTPEDAAHYNANAELDMENRKPKEYLEGMGKTELPNVGHRGKAMDAPKGPEKLYPDNAASRETLKAASFEYKVKAAAEFWGPKLPATMSQNEKRAHVIALAGMPEDLQTGYISSLYGR
jgi:hypothetical protein